jgi:Flp pilus assembly protein TadD
MLVNNVEPIWFQPLDISGITVQVKENMTEITFLLSHPALYRLETSDLQNQLSLIFDNAHSQVALPPLQYLHTAIQHIVSKNDNGDLRFNLLLSPSAVLKNVSLNNENKELVLTFENSLPDNVTPTQMESAIKTPATHSLFLQSYQQALNEADKGNYAAAISQLDALLKIEPDDSNARVSLAALLLDRGDPLKANLVVDEGLVFNPDYVPYIELKARLLTQAGKIKQALTLLHTASPSLTENPEYHAFIAALYERMNKDQLAIRIYRQLLSLNPENGNWWFGLGVSLEKIGQKKSALNAYSKALTAGHLTSSSTTFLQNRLQALEERTNEV